ncbi:MAG: hypothetical protein GY940_07185 [bacterium]|nr:hypothetical protein [bacterium]
MFDNFNLKIVLWFHLIVDGEEPGTLKEQTMWVLLSMTQWLANLPSWFPGPQVAIQPVGREFRRNGQNVRRFEIVIEFRVLSRLFQALQKVMEPFMVKDTSISKIIEKIIGPFMVKDTSISVLTQSLLVIIFKWLINSPDSFQVRSVTLTPVPDQPGEERPVPPVTLGNDGEEDQKAA